MLVISPGAKSAAVMVYVAVQVTVAPTASDAAPAGQVGTGAVPEPENAVSFTVTLVSVTLPVLVTLYEYWTTSPTLATLAGVTDLTTVNAGAGVAGTSL